MIVKGDVWIKQRRNFRIRGNSQLHFIEDYLFKNFQNGYPVVVASARSGFSLIFKYAFNQDTIRIFPYASQCIISAAFASGKFICTPLPYRQRDVIYHQWGYQKVTEDKNTFFVEDAADSFYPIGGKVRKNDSKFEMWSLSKILGSSSGGVIWCRDEIDAKELRNLVKESKKQNFFLELILWRLKSTSGVAYKAWENYKFSHLKLNNLQVKSLDNFLLNWKNIYEERKTMYLEANENELGISTTESESILKNNFGIIPVVIKSVQKVKYYFVEIHEILENSDVKKVNVCAYQNTKTKSRSVH